MSDVKLQSNLSSKMPRVILAENEMLVKQYNCTGVTQGKTSETTDICVTTKRLIKSINTCGGGNELSRMEQIRIEDIKNIRSEKSLGKNTALLILGIVLCALGVLLTILFAVSKAVVPAIIAFLVFGIAGGILIWRGLIVKKLSWLLIEAKSYDPAFSVGVRRFGSKANTAARIDVMLYEGIDKLIEELLPIVLDIQDIGDLAADKWSAKQ